MRIKSTVAPLATFLLVSVSLLAAAAPAPAAGGSAGPSSDRQLLAANVDAATADRPVLLAAADDDLLGAPEPVAPKPAGKPLPPPKAQPTDPVDPHANAFAKTQYPSAAECAGCHKQIYDEWRASNHAYASISPVFHKFEQTINDLSQGTVGYFCMRCHASAGTSLKESRDLALWSRADVSREGVTCVTCHRVSEQYSKMNGDRHIDTGDIFAPVNGNLDPSGVAGVIAQKDDYHVKISADEAGPGQNIHRAGVKFAQIGTSEFCVSCHQVAVYPGIKLEVVWDQYRASPSAAAGTTCEECHMGKVPGRAEGYATGPVAVVGGQEVEPGQKHYNHNFYGPGYPIVHPGLFPHNADAKRFAVQTWLKFDYLAGWGTDDFEAKVAKDPGQYKFPDEWTEAADRTDARAIVADNLKLLDKKRQLREAVMENGSHLDGPFFRGDPVAGHALKLTYTLKNLNPGHNLPSGSLGAQPEIWLDVAVFDPQGKNVWESGYTDSHGDMADLHSRDVRAGKIADDGQLFNLQTKFLTTNLKGTDREMYLPINLDFDQLPFIRPAGVPTTVLNHPPFVRMESRSIPPLGQKDADYTIPASALKAPGKYRISVRERSRAEPMYFMDFIGATREMDAAMDSWMINLHSYSAEFTVSP
jgi:hypothetical protein